MVDSTTACFQAGFAAGRMLDGRYQTYSPLNHGSFGMVLLAKDTFTGRLVAVKCLTKALPGSDNDSGFKVDDRSEELMIHSRIRLHPNIVNLLDSFETDTHSFIVLEYCSMGDLYEAIRQDKGPKQTDHVKSFMLQLVSALESLHTSGIYHRDIKPENIFLTDSGDMKLGDFGLATTDTWSYETAVGSDRYMAPEQYEHMGMGLSPARADIWSLGICLLNILFSRNPFAVPSLSDPLYRDFVNDRQSLFDVFPNMSQDTFQVLLHCLALDPRKRDLALVRESLEGVISFTTDDESVDDFCHQDREHVTATVGRQPLRTPSVTSPTLSDSGNAFPWAKAWHMTSPRKLSVIPDTISEDLFHNSDASSPPDWFDRTDTQSFDSSAIDSGFGASVGSSLHLPESRAKPVAIVGSLPSRATSAFASLFGRKKAFESKSWNDLYEEDEEEDAARARLPVIEEKKPTSKRPSFFSRNSRVSVLSQGEDSEDGRSTPRAGSFVNPKAAAVVVNDASARAPTPGKDINVCDDTGFLFEDDEDTITMPPASKYSPPTKRGFGDKWAALGERRRNVAETPLPAPKPLEESSLKNRLRQTQIGNKFSSQTQQLDHTVWQQKEWNLSRDWRRSNQDLPNRSSPINSHCDADVDADVHSGFKTLHC